MALPVGTKAPDFTLKTKTPSGIDEVRLGDHFGKSAIVLLFFPAAFTSVCTDEMKTCSAAFADLDDVDAVVYGISVDSPFAQEAWAEKEGIKVTLLSDYDRQVSKAYDVLLDDLIGLGPSSKRAAVVIDKSGVIIHTEEVELGKLPSFDAIKIALRK